MSCDLKVTNESMCFWEKTSGYITKNLFNTCTASIKDLRDFANATCLSSLFHSCMDLGKKKTYNKLIGYLIFWSSPTSGVIKQCEQEVSNLTTLTCNICLKPLVMYTVSTKGSSQLISNFLI